MNVTDLVEETSCWPNFFQCNRSCETTTTSTYKQYVTDWYKIVLSAQHSWGCLGGLKVCVLNGDGTESNVESYGNLVERTYHLIQDTFARHLEKQLNATDAILILEKLSLATHILEKKMADVKRESSNSNSFFKISAAVSDLFKKVLFDPDIPFETITARVESCRARIELNSLQEQLAKGREKIHQMEIASYKGEIAGNESVINAHELSTTLQDERRKEFLANPNQPFNPELCRKLGEELTARQEAIPIAKCQEKVSAESYQKELKYWTAQETLLIHRIKLLVKDMRAKGIPVTENELAI